MPFAYELRRGCTKEPSSADSQSSFLTPFRKERGKDAAPSVIVVMTSGQPPSSSPPAVPPRAREAGAASVLQFWKSPLILDNLKFFKPCPRLDHNNVFC